MGWSGLGKTLGAVRSSDQLKWANSLEVKEALEQVYLEEFGVKVIENQAALKAAKDKVRQSLSSSAYLSACSSS